MNYIMHIFLSDLPYVETEVRFINGREEECLIIPVRPNQIKKGNRGDYLMMARLAECPPNEKMITHYMQLMYLSHEEADKAYQMGYHYRTAHMGRVRVHDRTPEKRIDRTNMATDIECRGSVILSDIPKSVIFRNGANDKRYINHLVFRNPNDGTFIYTGVICVDDIPRDDIKTEPNTGKKYVDTIFRRLKVIDTYMNTHQLIIAKDDGSEIEIGRFKEWRATTSADATQQQTQTQQPAYPTRRPDYINGIKF